MKKKDVALFQVRDFPVGLRHSFKVACAIEGVSMREKMIELVGNYVEKKEKKAKSKTGRATNPVKATALPKAPTPQRGVEL